MKNRIIQLLEENKELDFFEIPKVLGISTEAFKDELKKLQADKTLLGLRPVFYPEAEKKQGVRSVIKVKITPERDCGFNRIAERISRFEEVESCYLMSGGDYDLLVFVRAKDLHEAASFVYEKLATTQGVVSTGTHFMLCAYKEQGYFLGDEKAQAEKLPVSP